MHPGRSCGRSEREAGLSLLEVTLALFLLVVGAISFGGVLVILKQDANDRTDRARLVDAAVSLVEEMRAEDPRLLHQKFHGRSIQVAGIEGGHPNGAALLVSVDASEAKLPTLTVNATWTSRGQLLEMELLTTVYSNEGQL